MQNPTFSIVMVSYFHEGYIKDAIESVLSQSTKESYEILIGDDGSKDGTVSIIRAYEEEYQFIHIYAHENWGLSKNIYFLLKQAKGKYIAILEGDDYWIDNNKLDKQKAIIDGNPCVATACNSKKIDNDGNVLGYWNNRKESKLLSKEDVLLYQTEICHPSGIMMKNIFLNSGDKYDLIEKASRMGGNHTGMINLLSSVGGLYFDVTPMTVWRVVVIQGAKNYSSQKANKPLDYYEAMKKYEMYDEKLSYNYERHIRQQYRACIKALRREFINSVGHKRYILSIPECLYYKIWLKMRSLMRRIKGIKI
jgi:glycosyltransferase involved in cell wall biosynthesis